MIFKMVQIFSFFLTLLFSVICFVSLIFLQIFLAIYFVVCKFVCTFAPAKENRRVFVWVKSRRREKNKIFSQIILLV